MNPFRVASLPKWPQNRPIMTEPAESAAAVHATLTVAAVARRIGVAPATLRTWDRRYGLGPSAREAGCHRRYTADDLAVLEAMRTLLSQGVRPADAARLAVERGKSAVVTHLVLARASVRPQQGDPADVLRGLARSVDALDSLACQQQLTAHLDHFGAGPTWNDLVRPLLVQMGEVWAQTQTGIEREHLLSEAAASAFTAHAAKVLTRRNRRPVLLAAAPDEFHTLPLLATAAAAAEQQIECRFLGSRVPHSALVGAITRIGPAAVLLWSQSSATGDPTQLASLPIQRPSYRVLVAGPGWAAHLPRNVLRVGSLSDALTELAAAAG